MATIQLSIDGGTLNCRDINAASGELITWTLDPSQGSIISFTAGTGDIFSGPPQLSRGVLTATIGAGKAGQNETYTIEVQPSAIGSSRIRPPRPPRITIMAT